MTSPSDQVKQEGANLSIVAPSDAYSLNAPYANYGDAYTVLAHGPTEKGEMFVYSRADCRDDSCSKLSPHDLAKIIKSDSHYHEGQAIALFACNAGRWGDASYAQALSNEIGAKVFAPNENITGLLAVGTNEDKGHDQFNGWVIAKDIKEVDPSPQPPHIVNIFGNVQVLVDAPIYNKIIVDPNGKLKYLEIEGEGKFETFSPQKEVEKDTKTKINPSEIHGNSDSVNLYGLIKIAQHISTMPELQQEIFQQRVAELMNKNDLRIEMDEKSNEIGLG